MKFRTRIFISVGAVLVVTSGLSYFLPDWLMRKELSHAAVTINKMINQEEERFLKLIEKMIIGRFAEMQQEMDTFVATVTHLDSLQHESFYQAIQTVLPFHERLGYIQIALPQGPIYFTPTRFRTYPFSVFKQEEHTYVKFMIEGHPLFRAQEIKNNTYALYPTDQNIIDMIHQSYPAVTLDWTEQAVVLETMLSLYPKDQSLAGYVQVSPHQNFAILSQDLFAPMQIKGAPFALDGQRGQLLEMQSIMMGKYAGHLELARASFLVEDQN